MKAGKLLHAAIITLLAAGPAAAGIDGSQAGVQGVEINFQPQQGEVDGTAFQAVEGSFVFPLSGSWGGQLDFLSGDADDPLRDFDIQGFTGHIFVRDRKTGTIDFSVSNVQTGIIDYSRVQLYGAMYFDKRTLSAATGYQSGDVPHSFSGSIQLREYIGDALTFNVDAGAVDSQFIYAAGFDYKTPLNGLHLFGQSFAGNEGLDGYRFGIKLYLGTPATSSKQRDRQLALATGVLNSFLESFHEVVAAQNKALQQPAPGLPSEISDNPP